MSDLPKNQGTLKDRRTEILRGAPLRESSDILEHLRQLLPKLHRAEQNVAQIILNDPQWVINNPIKQLAIRAKVSEPTVMRLCRKMELQGFAAFKLKLAQDLVVGEMLDLADDAGKDSQTSFAQLVHSYAFQALRQAANPLNDKLLSELATQINAARRIFCMPTDSRALGLATEAEARFFRLGIASRCTQGRLDQDALAREASKGDLLLYFSMEKDQHYALEGVMQAKENKVCICAIVPHGSPLASVADLFVPFDPSIFLDEQNHIHSNKYAELFLLDCIELAIASVRN
ncbi:HTH-type transcriptional regulator HexR [Maritalea myrionectae]|uniref:HTH-type transcriptional regulator HexR n=1 Tax=Maritalea myrionectae TaxID=454601 RepID=A0A2R4MG30_9HYPH|nr:MurR/RpiR family transcriptional regulator [Maritalea myrionectae]AVX04923.1 HTH-type transcriptional regulator HexR [Maritalea myrionectae]